MKKHHEEPGHSFFLLGDISLNYHSAGLSLQDTNLEVSITGGVGWVGWYMWQAGHAGDLIS